MKFLKFLLSINLITLYNFTFPSLETLKKEGDNLVQHLKNISSSKLHLSNIQLALRIAQAKTDEDADESDLLKEHIKQLKQLVQKTAKSNLGITKLRRDLKKELILLTDHAAPRDNEVE